MAEILITSALAEVVNYAGEYMQNFAETFEKTSPLPGISYAAPSMWIITFPVFNFSSLL